MAGVLDRGGTLRDPPRSSAFPGRAHSLQPFNPHFLDRLRTQHDLRPRQWGGTQSGETPSASVSSPLTFAPQP